MIPIVLYTTNRATAAAIRSANGMIPGLRGNDLLLESRQQPLPLSQGQPQIGDLRRGSNQGNTRSTETLGWRGFGEIQFNRKQYFLNHAPSCGVSPTAAPARGSDEIDRGPAWPSTCRSRTTRRSAGASAANSNAAPGL